MDQPRSASVTASLWSPLVLAYGLFGPGCAHMDALPSAQQDGKTFRSIGIATAPTSEPGSKLAGPPAPVMRTTAPPPGAADPRALAVRPDPEPTEPIPEPPAAIAVEPPAEPAPMPLPIPPPPVAVAVAPPAREATAEPEATPEVAAAHDPSGANRARLTPANLVAESRKAVDALSGYQVQLDRQERVGPKLQEKESVKLSIRRSPRAVRIEWPTGPNKGREVLFARGDGPDVMHVNMPGALVPRITLPINSPLAKRNSRHPIDEAGLESIVLYMERWIDEAPERARYEGGEIPPAYGKPCVKLTFQGDDGEVRIVHLDAQTRLPAMIRVTAPNGDLLEDYSFRDIRTDCPELAAAEAFDPTSRWGAPRGLRSRRKSAETEATDTPESVPGT